MSAKPARLAGQKPAKTARVLPRVFVPTNSLMSDV